MGTLQPIETCPKDGSYFLAWGKSGYNTTPLRCEVCHWDPSYRPRNPIQTHSNDAFTDGGEPAIFWSPLPFDIKVMDLEAMAIRSKIEELQDRLREIEG